MVTNNLTPENSENGKNKVTSFQLIPDFDFSIISNEEDQIQQNQSEIVKHSEILNRLLTQVEFIDFRSLAGFEGENEKLGKKHFLVCCIEKVLELAQSNNWGMCKNLDFIYLYNGAYWTLFDIDEIQGFLGAAAEKMGVDRFDAQHYLFQEQLFKQFLSKAFLPKPEQLNETVLINLKNGTFEISPKSQGLRSPNSNDFLTYQLPFDFKPDAKMPLFEAYLNKVQPDIACQQILAEYLAYVFIRPSTLKLEKTLLLYGPGANGKSVFFEIVNALLGPENVSSYSLQNLTKHDSYQRAMLATKLVNYASEINGNLETSIFKQLVSGEPVEARRIYGEPFTMTNYAKLIFNCNELPREVEQSLAYFRRFLIIPFDKTIPENEQDKELAKKIIESELSGVFNWVLEGLKRLLNQKRFTHSEAVSLQIEEYKMQSDSVRCFLNEENFVQSIKKSIEFKELFGLYKNYCQESNYRACSKKTFGDRIRKAGLVVEKKNFGLVVFVEKQSF